MVTLSLIETYITRGPRCSQMISNEQDPVHTLIDVQAMQLTFVQARECLTHLHQ